MINIEAINNLRLIVLPYEKIDLLNVKKTTVIIERKSCFVHGKWMHDVEYCDNGKVKRKRFASELQASCFAQERNKISLTPHPAFPELANPKAAEFPCFITYPSVALRIRNRTIGSCYKHSAHAYGWRIRLKGMESSGGGRTEEECRNKILQIIVDNSLWIIRKNKH